MTESFLTSILAISIAPAPIYIGLFFFFFHFRFLIKAMTEVNEIFSDLLSENDNESTNSKRDFLFKKLKNGEPISNSKTVWTLERLEKASDKVVNKLYEKHQNPPPVKINKQEALEFGKPMCPIFIQMYVEGLKGVIDQLPYISSRCTVNVFKLKKSILGNKAFCDNLAIKIGSKMIEQMGNDSPMYLGVTLAGMTWDSIEPIEKIEETSE